jgi:hypothetical protein
MWREKKEIQDMEIKNRIQETEFRRQKKNFYSNFPFTYKKLQFSYAKPSKDYWLKGA